jgi:hypothetical protein
VKDDGGELTHENKMGPLWQWHANMLKDGIAMEKAIWLDWATGFVILFIPAASPKPWTDRSSIRRGCATEARPPSVQYLLPKYPF